MRHYQKNADRDLRELERRAASGDMGARDQLLIEAMRRGELDYESAVALMAVNRGPICGWGLSWEHPGIVQLTPLPPWRDYVVVYATPWWDQEGTSFTPISLAHRDGSHQTPLRDLFTPNTGDPVADALNYRAEVAGALSALAGAATAMLVDGLNMTRNMAGQFLSEGLSGS
jgi:hypothetical protein